MEAVEAQRRGGRGPRTPALGVSFEGRPSGYLPVVAPLVDVIEVVPDCVVQPDGVTPTPAILDELDELATSHMLTYHGVGLSLGTATGWNEGYLRTLDALMSWRSPWWHSEHLGYTVVDGHFLGTMPALPTTEEAAELAADRATRLRQRYGIETLLEHVASPLIRPIELTPAAFLNAVARASGCGLILDLHNLRCDADNGLLDEDEFLDELDLSLVREIHLAGGTWHDGLHLDVHVGLTDDRVLDSLPDVLDRCPDVDLVVYEVLAGALPALSEEKLVGHLTALRAVLDGAEDAPAPA